MTEIMKQEANEANDNKVSGVNNNRNENLGLWEMLPFFPQKCKLKRETKRGGPSGVPPAYASQPVSIGEYTLECSDFAWYQMNPLPFFFFFRNSNIRNISSFIAVTSLITRDGSWNLLPVGFLCK